MLRHRLPGVLLGLALLFLAVSRLAYADTVDDETRRIGKQLQCPVCSGAPVSDSPSELAGQMRNVIRAKLRAGESEEQIIGYFVERYGDSILIEPPRHGFGLAVWIAPFGALAIGAVFVWGILRSWRRRERQVALVSVDALAAPYRNGTATSADDEHVSTLDRARAELDRYRREG
jgi:cytochrome c-type biogenesis protein CcmH